ncbi:MAG: hypothetical protein WCH05_05315 [Chlorobiaceae bacterium]
MSRGKSAIRNIDLPAIMKDLAHYTSLFAPPLYFLTGVVIVILVNKFVGKGTPAKKAE